MAGIERRSFDAPDHTMTFLNGRGDLVRVAGEDVWRSELRPGWSWDTDIKPLAGGAASCPLTHREYVVEGSIRYEMADGTEETGVAGDYLFIEPGHRAFVVGDETCVLIDW